LKNNNAKPKKIPFFVPNIDNSDKKAVLESLNQPILTNGPNLQKFEKVFAKFTGAKYAIGVTNATAALILSLNALELKKNDEVIVPDETFVATANAVLLNGAVPVLADIEDVGYNVSVESIEKSITKKTKVIMPVHIAGKACDIIKIRKLARDHDLKIIEDCAHAIGTKINGKHVGTFGEFGCFSFYPTKNITTIEGGMVITNSKKLATKIIAHRNHGFVTSKKFNSKPWLYDVELPGYNFRLDEIRSALGINQLKRIRKLNTLRKKACQYYNLKLKSINGIETPILSKFNDDVNHLYMIRVKKEYGITRDELFRKFMKLGIETSLHYTPLHEFTLFKKSAKKYVSLKNSKILYNELISLPMFPYISKKEQNTVIKYLSSNSTKNQVNDEK